MKNGAICSICGNISAADPGFYCPAMIYSLVVWTMIIRQIFDRYFGRTEMNKIIPAAGAADADSEVKPPTTSSDAVAAFDYAGEAELFPTRRWRSTRSSYGYRRFARAADAIRFAIEELPPELLLGSVLEVAE